MGPPHSGHTSGRGADVPATMALGRVCSSIVRTGWTSRACGKSLHSGGMKVLRAQWK